jgi:hypothetical protein
MKRATPATLRRAAAVQCLALVAGGAALALVCRRPGAAQVVWLAAAAWLVTTLIAPRAVGPVRRLGDALGRATGVVLVWLLLAPLYFLLFTPVAFSRRLRRLDPLRQRPAPAEATLWVTRRHAPDAESYRRQFRVEERS